MPYFAVATRVTTTVVHFVKSNDEDQAFTDVHCGKGEQVWHRILDNDINDVQELTEEQFKNKQIPESMK